MNDTDYITQTAEADPAERDERIDSFVHHAVARILTINAAYAIEGSGLRGVAVDLLLHALAEVEYGDHTRNVQCRHHRGRQVTTTTSTHVATLLTKDAALALNADNYESAGVLLRHALAELEHPHYLTDCTLTD